MSKIRVARKPVDAYQHGNLAEALVQAGLKLLSEGGVEKLSLRAAAQLAGVSHAAPYRHFRDKDALVSAIAERGYRLLTASMKEELERCRSREPGARLQAIGVGYLRFGLSHPAYLQVIFGGVLTADRGRRGPGQLGDGARPGHPHRERRHPRAGQRPGRPRPGPPGARPTSRRHRQVSRRVDPPRPYTGGACPHARGTGLSSVSPYCRSGVGRRKSLSVSSPLARGDPARKGIRAMIRPWRLVTGVGGVLVAALMIGCQAPADLESRSTALVTGPGGAVSCDFELPAELDPASIGPIIERDRMYMAERPGMRIKHLPFSLNTANFQVQTGGRYLFDTADSAREYLHWLRTGFRLDGFVFLERPFFINPQCTAWRVVGAAQWKPPAGSHYLMRTERLRAPAGGVTGAALAGHWLRIAAQARLRGLSAVRLNHEADAAGGARIEILQIGDRSIGNILAIGAATSLAAPLVAQGWRREFDRTQLVLTVWFPFVAGDQGPPALWPNSPPLPGPSCGDGLCEVSRGEDDVSCAGDCPVGCGDTVCQPASGENTQRCPGDCRLP
jgi:AcrR family transcriptional regulator